MRLPSALVTLAVLAPLAIGLASERPADAAPEPTVSVFSTAASTVHLRVSKDGDCDAAPDNLSYDGELQPDEMVHIPLSWWCVCATSTSVDTGDWNPWMRYCGPPRTSKRDSMTPRSFSIRIDGR